MQQFNSSSLMPWTSRPIVHKLRAISRVNGIRTLSVGNVAGVVSPAFLLLRLLSINWGVNLALLGLGVSSGFSSGCDVREMLAATGVASGVGNSAFTGLLLLWLVSIGTGANLLFSLGAKSFLSVISSFERLGEVPFALRFDLEVVSTGMTSNLRTFLVEGGGCDVDIVGMFNS